MKKLLKLPLVALLLQHALFINLPPYIKAPTMIINKMNSTKINAAAPTPLLVPGQAPWFIKPLLFITHFILWLKIDFGEYFYCIFLIDKL